jgi:hypothetical protein
MTFQKTVLRVSCLRLGVACLVVGLLCSSSGQTREQPSRPAPSRISSAQFRALMNKLAEGWNTNNARQAVSCFRDDALYSAPPAPRVRRGGRELYEFFGGDHGRPRPMHMTWHHLVFDEHEQIGAGEYTFEYDIRTHGIVIVKIVAGRIAQWREYEHESRLSWDELVKDNRF